MCRSRAFFVEIALLPLFRGKAWQKALLGTMNSGRSLYTPAGGKHALLTRRLRLRRGTMHGFVETDSSGATDCCRPRQVLSAARFQLLYHFMRFQVCGPERPGTVQADLLGNHRQGPGRITEVGRTVKSGQGKPCIASRHRRKRRVPSRAADNA